MDVHSREIAPRHNGNIPRARHLSHLPTNYLFHYLHGKRQLKKEKRKDKKPKSLGKTRSDNGSVPFCRTLAVIYARLSALFNYCTRQRPLVHLGASS